MSEDTVKEESAKMNIRVMKLKSGEEVVANIEGMMEDENTGEKTYLCLDPAFPAANPQDPNTFSFMPWMMFAADRTFIISRNDLVVDPRTVDEQIELEYKKYFVRGMEIQAEKERQSKEKDSPIIMPNEKKVVTLNK